MSSYQDVELLQQFASHISRARSVVIQGSSGVHATSSLLLSNPAPSLESLEIRAHEGPARDLGNFLGQQAPSLRSVLFVGISPVLGPSLSLPNLTTFHLYLPRSGPLHLTSRSLFQFLSTCPLLQDIEVYVPDETFQEVALDRVTSLESLVELEYRGYAAGRVLPHLKLPRLRKLDVSSTLPMGQVHKLADALPHGGRVLLGGATKMRYSSESCMQRIDFFGEGTNVSIAIGSVGDSAPVDWFADESRAPFGQIEDLEVGGLYVPPTFSFDPFKNLTIFRLTSWDTQCIEGFLRFLYPTPGIGIPCPSLREILCSSWVPQEQIMGSIISLVRERDQAGYRLELVCVFGMPKLNNDLEEELRRHVGELQVRISEDHA